MAPKVIASEMMNSHITNFLCGIAKAGASRSSSSGEFPTVRCASLKVPPESFQCRDGPPGSPQPSTQLASNSQPKQQKQINPKNAHEMPVLRSRIKSALAQHRPMQLTDHINKSEDSADHVQRVQYSENVKKRTARRGCQIKPLRPQLQPGRALPGHK